MKVHREKNRYRVRVHHEKKSDGHRVRVHHKREEILRKRAIEVMG